MMGPNVLWLAESLSQVLEFRPGMRVLDLGCGRAVSSIFLAKEFGAQVWAADLWIKPTENLRRIEEAGVSRPCVSDPRGGPPVALRGGLFRRGRGPRLLSLLDCYIGYIVRFIKRDGRLAIAVPGGPRELKEAPELKSVLSWDFWSFHGPGWWREHWQRTGLVEVEHAELIPDGWQHWLQSDRATGFDETMPDWVTALEADQGRTFGLSGVVARKLPVDQVWRPMWP